MRVLLLSNANSPHTIKWATALRDAGIDITIFSFGGLTVRDYDGKNIGLVFHPFDVTRSEGALSKLLMLKALPRLRHLIREFKPDIVHAHYASSYGMIGALSGFHPFVLSVWGSDVFSFPHVSPLHEMLLRFNLGKADTILSTSHVMARETRLYTRKEVVVTPFGIDMERFRRESVNSLFEEGALVVGTVKTLEDKYGIEYLIRAFKMVIDKHPALPLRLLIVGGGSLSERLKQVASELGIMDRTVFTGPVPYADVPRYHNMLSVSVSVSDSESFGVAVIEAQACEKPVVVSDVGGLPEVVEDGVTGIIVPRADVAATAAAIERLALDPALRERMGRAGRERVNRLFNWEENVRQMVGIYQRVVGA